MRVGVLQHAMDVSRNAVGRPGLRDHVCLHQAAVRQSVGVDVVGQEDAPGAEGVARHRVRPPIPSVEVTCQEQGISRRRPLAIPDARLAFVLSAIEAEVKVALADGPEQAAGMVDLSCDILVVPIPILQAVPIRLKPRVVCD